MKQKLTWSFEICFIFSMMSFNLYTNFQNKQQLIDEYVRRMMNELTVSQFMDFGHFADDFLIPTFFKCASDKFHPTELCK